MQRIILNLFIGFIKFTLSSSRMLHSQCVRVRLILGYGVRFRCAQQCIAFQGKRIVLPRALTDLVTNARRDAQRVDVRCARRRGGVLICVDDGPGIPVSQMEQLFKPFYRGDPSRNGDSGVFGLGLALTRDILVAHGGGVRINNWSTGGLSAQVFFPARPDESQEGSVRLSFGSRVFRLLYFKKII